LALLITVSKRYGTSDIRKLAELEWHATVEDERGKSETDGDDG